MEILNVPLIDVPGFVELVCRFLLNLFAAAVVIRFLYYPRTREIEYLFTFSLFNVVTFLICFLLRKVPMEMGFALGLFAVFGILRYRTETIPIREMTYLFLVIGLAMINALSNQSVSWLEIIFANFVIVLIPVAIEKITLTKRIDNQLVLYENIQNIKPENKAMLIEDLQNRTGLKVVKVKIESIDFLRDSAELRIYFIA